MEILNMQQQRSEERRDVPTRSAMVRAAPRRPACPPKRLREGCAGAHHRRFGAATAFILLSLLSLAGCARDESHPVQGIVVEVYSDPPALLVDHEEIPGVMAAMSMRFEVDAATIDDVKVGDAITARLRLQDQTWRLDQVKVVPQP